MSVIPTPPKKKTNQPRWVFCGSCHPSSFTYFAKKKKKTGPLHSGFWALKLRGSESSAIKTWILNCHHEDSFHLHPAIDWLINPAIWEAKNSLVGRFVSSSLNRACVSVHINLHLQMQQNHVFFGSLRRRFYKPFERCRLQKLQSESLKRLFFATDSVVVY